MNEKVNGFEIGNQPPNYMWWHAWADAQAKGGLSQTRCQSCGKFFFPQEKHCEVTP